MVSEKKPKMSELIRGHGSHLGFQMGQKNTNFVEDVEFLLPDKFVTFRSAVAKKSKMQLCKNYDGQRGSGAQEKKKPFIFQRTGLFYIQNISVQWQ